LAGRLGSRGHGLDQRGGFGFVPTESGEEQRRVGDEAGACRRCQRLFLGGERGSRRKVAAPDRHHGHRA
jgi:hypothetical protein